MQEPYVTPVADTTISCLPLVPTVVCWYRTAQDTEISFLNISKSDEWEAIWDLFETQIEPYAGMVLYR
jgi:hypothetical protein